MLQKYLMLKDAAWCVYFGSECTQAVSCETVAVFRMQGHCAQVKKLNRAGRLYLNMEFVDILRPIGLN